MQTPNAIDVHVSSPQNLEEQLEAAVKELQQAAILIVGAESWLPATNLEDTPSPSRTRFHSE